MNRSTLVGVARGLAGLSGLALCARAVIMLQAIPSGLAEFSYLARALDPMPFAAMRGFTFEQLDSHVVHVLLLGPGLLLISWALVPLFRRVPPITRWSPGHVWRGATLLSLVVATFVLFRVTLGRAIVDDELTYGMQAGLLSQGRITDDTLLQVPQWHEHFTIFTAHGPTGKYLFGEPLVLVPGVLLGVPPLLHLLWIPLIGWAWFGALRDDQGEPVAAWSTALVVLSPMFLLTTPLALSHTTTLAALALAGLGLAWIRGQRWTLGALLVGTALGFALTVRPQTVVPFGVFLGLWATGSLLRARRWGALGLLMGSLLPWLLAIAAYNHRLSGQVTTLPWFLFGFKERYGFGDVFDVGVHEHTALKAAVNLLVSTVRFNGWFLGWPLSLLPLLAWLGLGRPGRRLWVWGLASAGLLVFNFAYYSTGVSDTGPVYYYELLLPAALITALALLQSARRWPVFTTSLVVVHLVAGTGGFLWEQGARLQRLVDAIHGPAQAILSQVQPPALLIVESDFEYARNIGWVTARFPYRYRSDSDPVVVHPRSDGDYVSALRERYADRRCYYARYVQAAGRVDLVPELYPCEAVEELLSRPAAELGLLCLPSSAASLHLREPGWLPRFWQAVWSR